MLVGLVLRHVKPHLVATAFQNHGREMLADCIWTRRVLDCGLLRLILFVSCFFAMASRIAVLPEYK
jgi:hypothetical protein